MHNIFFLARFFKDPKEAAELVRGKIYANALKYFQNLESEDASGRADPCEGMMAWLQPGEITLVLNGMDITADLAGPVEAQTNWAKYLNVFCLHAGHSEVLDVPSRTGLTVEQIQQELLIPDTCYSFGEHAVVILDTPEFIRRVEAALPGGVNMCKGLVEYYDPDTFSGHFFGVQPTFRKHKKYSYQREYRLVFESPSERDTPLVFEVGDLSDITRQLKSAELNNSLKMALR